MRKILALAFAAFLLGGCGPYYKKSYSPDHKLRADYLVKNVRARFDIIPTCRTRGVLLLYLSRTCVEPYFLTVTFHSDRETQDSNTVNFSVQLVAGGRTYRLMNPVEEGRWMSLEPVSNGAFETLLNFDLGRRVTRESGPFKVILNYKFKDQSSYSIIEKAFDASETRGITTVFSKNEPRQTTLRGAYIVPPPTPPR